MSWRDRILQYFAEPLPPVLLVADPDGLLLDEILLSEMEKRKIELLPFEDRAKFRYLYERYYRDQKGKTLLVYVPDEEVDHLPFDLIRIGQPITLKISQFFPHFPPSIIRKLDTHALDALYAHSQGIQGPLSSGETYDFLLRRVYKLPYDSVDSLAEFIRLLIKKHDSPYPMPEELEQFLIAYFQKAPFLKSFPLDQLVSSPDYFYSYLEQEWRAFIQQNPINEGVIREKCQGSFCGLHPFEQPDLRHDLARLMLEGKVDLGEQGGFVLLTEGGAPYLPLSDLAQKESQFKLLLKQLEAKSTENPSYKHWLDIMPLWAEAKYICIHCDLDDSQFNLLERRYEEQFQNWMLTDYSALANLPYVHGPIMVHHVPHYLRLKRSKKIALLVIDGMSFLQWKQIKAYLSKAFQCYERGVFAWVPTLTSVSRQALFSGELPFHFADSIHTTQKEAALWQLFWEQQGVPKGRVSFQKGLGQGVYQPEQIEGVRHPHIQVAGLVIDTLDRLMHRALQGYKGFLAEIDIWLQGGYLIRLIQDLLDQGYDLYLTSDHGNTESVGIGRINEGVLADQRGERVRIYRDKNLRDQAAQQYSSIPWPQIALPQDWFVLLSQRGEAFVREGEQVISHGGISLEEVIVPFVHITPKQKNV